MKKGEEVTFCLHSQKMVAKKSFKKKKTFFVLPMKPKLKHVSVK